MLKPKLFEDPHSQESQFGLLKREILATSFLLRAGKFYWITNDTDGIKRAKSVSRKCTAKLGQSKFTQDPEANRSSVTFQKFAIGENNQGVMMVKESKELIHSYCLNRIANDPVHTIALP